MVVATKEMKIESGYCPALSMHVGEVNKQYILVPPIDISGYSVRSEIVKPDHTFVYTDQYINTDGNILFTLPEQAGAVAGYGYYIIKIYNLNTIVYSMVGNLIIDDHLIMDGMIESVAEVNGYNFPDDFMMRGDLSFIFDDTAVSNETGWSSTKIKDYVDQSVLENYSTSERVVGTWIDGGTLYEKTYTISQTGSGYQVYDFTGLNTSEVTNMFVREGIAFAPSSSPSPYSSVPLDSYSSYDQGGYGFNGFVTTNSAGMYQLHYRIGSTLVGGTAIITVRYTKAAD